MSVTAAAPNLPYSDIVHIIYFGNYFQFLELHHDGLIFLFLNAYQQFTKL